MSDDKFKKKKTQYIYLSDSDVVTTKKKMTSTIDYISSS